MFVQTRTNNLQKLLADVKSLSKLWPYLRENKGLIYASMALIPVISLLQMSLPLIVRRTIDQGISQGIAQEIYFGVGVGVFIVVSEYLSRAGQTMMTALAVHRMIRVMRESLIRHVLRLSPRFHDRSLSGALVTRATSDFDNLSESLNQGVLTSVVDIAVLLGAVVGLFILNWQLALTTLIILPLVTFIVVSFSKYLKRAMLAARVKIASLNAFTQECLYGVNTVKTLTAQNDAQKKLDTLAVEYRKTQMKSVILDAMLFAILDGISSITIGIIFWIAVSHLTDGNTALTAGIMIAFVQYIQNLFDPLKQLGNKIAMLQGAFTSLERIFGILQRKEFIHGDEIPHISAGKVQFEHVNFQYDPDSKKTVLTDVSFTLPAGQSLALVGATGSGKSTIIKLLTKLYDQYQGKITIDDQDLALLNPELLRKQIALVPQDIILFEGSILFNLTLGHSEIREEDAIAAAGIVGADSFIESLPGKYQFEIREGGQNLSQGQRQLLAFARALARQPKVIVLDEATSSVDPQSEFLIQHAIDRMLKGRTVIVIAHRLSTVRRCDHIIVLKKGRVIEQGNHESLLANQHHYYRLHQSLID
ncbi:MAG: ABC transporter ATP-binding protein [Oligoflexus sp.]